MGLLGVFLAGVFFLLAGSVVLFPVPRKRVRLPVAPLHKDRGVVLTASALLAKAEAMLKRRRGGKGQTRTSEDFVSGYRFL
jgi:hypothetical protein